MIATLEPLLVFFDTNILLFPTKRNYLLSLAETGAFMPFWSEDVERELCETGPRQTRQTPQRIQLLIEHMRTRFPAALVRRVRYANLEATVTGMPDCDDRHVFAAASEARCSIIVTENLRHFSPASIHGFCPHAMSADSLASTLYQRTTRRCLDAVMEHIAVRLVDKDLIPDADTYIDQYLASLEKAGFKHHCKELRMLSDGLKARYRRNFTV